MIRKLIPVLIILLFLTNVYAQENGSIKASFIQANLKFDGLLTEDFWKSAHSVSDFTQMEPFEGTQPSEKTEVKIVYNKDNLYIGVICYDSQPDRIIHKELKKDSRLFADDNIEIILDTYLDYRSGFYFATNANGARVDGLLGSGESSGHHGPDASWDGVWDVRAKIADYGWSAEIMIPFKTLRFPKGDKQTWGFNIQRKIIKTNEEVLWRSWLRKQGLQQLQNAGVITGLTNIERGSALEAKPYFSTGVEKLYNENSDTSTKTGLDVKYPLGPNMTLDLTTFTDFAQVESDRTRINLTRFSLQYEEKRGFFLEDLERFKFGTESDNIYYSRRLGLTPERTEVPILAGVRLTGKTDGLSIGFMNIITDRKNGTPAANNTVLRLKQDLFERSHIGFVLTNLIDKDHKNLVGGLDFTYKTDEFLQNYNLEFSTNIAMSGTSGADNKDNRTGNIKISLPNDKFDLSMGHGFIEKNFNSELGFIRRTNIMTSDFSFRLNPRPKILGIRRAEIELLVLDYVHSSEGRLLEKSMGFRPIVLHFESREDIIYSFSKEYEYLDEDFNIFSDVVIPIGKYEWTEHELRFMTNSSRPLYGELEYGWGGFYNGKRENYKIEATYKLNKHLSVSGNFDFNKISASEQSFKTKEYSLTANANFSTRLTSRLFMQWNNEDESLNMNFLINYIPKIGSDIYFVYNHSGTWNGILLKKGGRYYDINKTAIFKIAYLKRF
ncbi:DUF5916 domain-containing protein [candidate division KSB1 bacterium]